jgi:hypothetical protein
MRTVSAQFFDPKGAQARMAGNRGTKFSRGFLIIHNENAHWHGCTPGDGFVGRIIKTKLIIPLLGIVAAS